MFESEGPVRQFRIRFEGKFSSGSFKTAGRTLIPRNPRRFSQICSTNFCVFSKFQVFRNRGRLMHGEYFYFIIWIEPSSYLHNFSSNKFSKYFHDVRIINYNCYLKKDLIYICCYNQLSRIHGKTTVFGFCPSDDDDIYLYIYAQTR